MYHTLSLYVLYFFIYSLFGWLWEVLYFAAKERRFRNGGIVTAPLLPIYGVGAVALIALMQIHINNPFYVFVLSSIVASAVEFVGHWLIEVLFRAQLWDYRDRRFNLQGRICLENSLGFGILALGMLYVVQPWLESILAFLPAKFIVIISVVLLVIFVLDLTNSLRSMIKLRRDAGMQSSIGDIQQRLDAQLLKIREERRAIHAARVSRWSVWGLTLHRFTTRRFARAFPSAHFVSRRRSKKQTRKP